MLQVPLIKTKKLEAHKCFYMNFKWATFKSVYLAYFENIIQDLKYKADNMFKENRNII